MIGGGLLAAAMRLRGAPRGADFERPAGACPILPQPLLRASSTASCIHQTLVRECSQGSQSSHDPMKELSSDRLIAKILQSALAPALILPQPLLRTSGTASCIEQHSSGCNKMGHFAIS